MPFAIIADLEQDQFAGPERVHGLQNNGGDHGAEEALPHGAVRKGRHHFLQGKQDTSDGRTERDRHAGCTRSRQNFTHLHFIQKKHD